MEIQIIFFKGNFRVCFFKKKKKKTIRWFFPLKKSMTFFVIEKQIQRVLSSRAMRRIDFSYVNDQDNYVGKEIKKRDQIQY